MRKIQERLKAFFLRVTSHPFSSKGDAAVPVVAHAGEDDDRSPPQHHPPARRFDYHAPASPPTERTHSLKSSEKSSERPVPVGLQSSRDETHGALPAAEDCEQSTAVPTTLWAFRTQSDTSRPAGGCRAPAATATPEHVRFGSPAAERGVDAIAVGSRAMTVPVEAASDDGPAGPAGRGEAAAADEALTLCVPASCSPRPQTTKAAAPPLKAIKSKSGLREGPARADAAGGSSAVCLADFLSRFEQGPTLGQGSTGVVYTLREISTAKQFACKMMQFTSSGSPASDISTRFLDDAAADDCQCSQEDAELELMLLKMLRHPNLVALHDFYIDNNHCVMIMDLLRGGDLLRYLKRRRTLPEPEAKIVIRCVLRCLSYLHSQGIAHRDIKLENLLLESDSDVASGLKVVDLGMAKFIRRQGCNNPARTLHTICGTPLYIAPEMLSCVGSETGKMRSQYGTEIDIWACGIVLYMILSGREPYSSKMHLGELLKRIQCGELAFLPPLLGSVSADAGNLLKRMLEVDPCSRITAEDALRHAWLQT